MPFLFPGEEFEIENTKLGLKERDFINNDNRIIAAKSGFVKYSKKLVSISNMQKRYLPAQGDYVIGIVVSKHSEYYRVDIQAPFLAFLDLCGFENATKRNRPNLAPKSVVYGRIISNDPDFEPEIECMDADGKKAQFGELVCGTVINCSLRMAESYDILTKPKKPRSSYF
jgi:exosome complex component RRP40